jgi:putative RNA 2'-phosphotransferase
MNFKQYGKIRAYYGHSTPHKITQEVTAPPTILFHGTTPQAARAIRVEGLKPMKRHYVQTGEGQQEMPPG